MLQTVKKLKYSLLLLLLPIISFGQARSRADSLDYFVLEKFEIDFLKELNKWRMEEGVDTLEINETLQKASTHHAQYMAQQNSAKLEEDIKHMVTTGERVMSFGGTKNAEELVFAANMFKNGEEGTNKDMINTILGKWKNSKKERPILLNGNYIYCGVKGWIGNNDKKIFFSIVFGSYNTFNGGKSHRKELTPSFTKKPKKIKTPENIVKECKNCEKFKSYDKLYEGLYTEKGKVFIRYDDIKGLRKLLKGPADGLDVDIVQRAQYGKGDYSILDNNLPTKGIVLKMRNSDYIFNKNRAAGDDVDKAPILDVCLGKMPKKLKGDYEMNLLVIQNGKVCKTITKSYVEEGSAESGNTELELLLMPDSNAYLKPKFVPKADNTIIEFTVPFEKNKFDYKIEDIQPIMSAMNEPDYIIEGIYIYAYSSIEGDSISNAKLQKKRGESIIGAFNKMLGKEVMANVLTNDSWDLFRLVMEDGEFAYLTEMKKRDAIRKINTSPELLEKLEPYLSQQRFAKVILDITYDIKGAKEQKYVMSLFNKAVKKGDYKTAHKLQYFIEDQYAKGKYSIETLALAEIAKVPRNAGILSNRIVFKYHRNFKTLAPEDVDYLEEFHKLDPTNDYVKFNHLTAQVKFTDRVSFKGKDEFQAQIESLYKTKVPKKYVDALNTEFQFKIIAAADTMPNSGPIIESCINKIKSFYNFKEGSAENALKLTYVFASFKDYRFAIQTIEPFVFIDGVTEEVLFTYISLCAQLPDKIKSHRFAAAMEMAHKMNSERYCNLMGKPYLSFQIMDNPDVRKYYLSTGCEQQRATSHE